MHNRTFLDLHNFQFRHCNRRSDPFHHRPMTLELHRLLLWHLNSPSTQVSLLGMGTSSLPSRQLTMVFLPLHDRRIQRPLSRHWNSLCAKQINGESFISCIWTIWISVHDSVSRNAPSVYLTLKLSEIMAKRKISFLVDTRVTVVVTIADPFARNAAQRFVVIARKLRGQTLG